MQRLQQAEASASATMMLPRTTVPPRERVEAGGRLSTAPTAAMAAGARQPCGGRGDLRRAFSYIVNTDLTNAAALERRAEPTVTVYGVFRVNFVGPKRRVERFCSLNAKSK